MDVEESMYRGRDTVDDLLSAFKSVAVRVTAKPAPEPPFEPSSAIKLRASILHRPLWDASDTTANENWSRVVVPALEEALPRIQRDLTRCSEPASYRSTDLHLLSFPRFDVQVDPYLLSFLAPANFTVPEGIIDSLQSFRTMLDSGAFGTRDIARVDIPFIDVDAAWEAYNAKLAAEAAASEAESASGGTEEAWQGEPPADETGTAAAEPSEIAGDHDGETGEDTAPEPGLEPEPIDRTVWGVTLRDGSFFLFDSVQGEILQGEGREAVE